MEYETGYPADWRGMSYGAFDLLEMARWLGGRAGKRAPFSVRYELERIVSDRVSSLIGRGCHSRQCDSLTISGCADHSPATTPQRRAT